MGRQSGRGQVLPHRLPAAHHRVSPLRIGIACIALWARWRGVRLLPEKGEWRSLWIAALLFAVQITLMNIGFHHTSGAMGSVLIATNPLFAVMFAHFLVAGDRMTAGKALGLLVAMAGTSLALLGDADLAALDPGAAGNWIVLSSAVMLGLRLSLSARFVRRIDPTRVAMWQMVLSLPLFGAGALLLEEIAWDRVGPGPIAGLLFQGAVIAGVGFTVSYHLMKRYTPSVMMSFNFISPIAAWCSRRGCWAIGSAHSCSPGWGWSRWGCISSRDGPGPPADCARARIGASRGRTGPDRALEEAKGFVSDTDGGSPGASHRFRPRRTPATGGRPGVRERARARRRRSIEAGRDRTQPIDAFPNVRRVPGERGETEIVEVVVTGGPVALEPREHVSAFAPCGGIFRIERDHAIGDHEQPFEIALPLVYPLQVAQDPHRDGPA